MTASTILIMFLAAFFSGMVNAIAGGGTFLTFGVLTLVGLPPVTANATSSIVQFPGYVTSTLAYLKEFRSLAKSAIVLGVISAIFAFFGSWTLVSMSNPAFRQLVPWLLLGATAIFALGPKLKPKASAERHPPGPVGLVIHAATSFYGGFFGAGMGIMMLASLGLATGGLYHRLNALKNFLSIVIAAVAIAVFSTGGLVSWWHAAIMIPGVAAGGYAGVHVARKAPQGLIRGVVIGVGTMLAIYYFLSA